MPWRLAWVWLAVIWMVAAGSSLDAQTALAGATVSLDPSIYLICSVAVDGNGNVFFVTYEGNQVYEMVAVNGVVLPGTQPIAYAEFDNGTSGSDAFQNLTGVAVDANGNVFVASGGDGGATSGTVKEILAVNGTVAAGSTVSTIASGLNFPIAVTVGSSGNVSFIDYAPNSARTVYEITASNGAVAPGSVPYQVGHGYSDPIRVAVDANGNVFIADIGDDTIKEIVAVNGVVNSNSTTIPLVTQVSGGASFFPQGVGVDGSGNVYFTDAEAIGVSDGGVYEIVAVNGEVSTSSTVKTLATGLDFSDSVAVDSNGNIFFDPEALDEIVAGSQKFPTTPVGTPSAPLTTYFTFTSSGMLATTPYVVLTQGAQGKDFQASPSASQPANACVSGHTYNTGDICTVNVTFTPTLPYQRLGAVQLMGSAGVPIATVNLRGIGTGPQVLYPSNSAVAAVSSNFITPIAMAVDGSGDIFVADQGNGNPNSSAVKEIVAANGVVSSGSTPTQVGSYFGSLTSVAVDGSGNVFVVDAGNKAVYEIAAVNGVITSAMFTVATSFKAPSGVAVDGSGNVFVSDTSDNAVFEIVAVNGVVLPGYTPTEVAIGFDHPEALAVDGSGNVFVADVGNGAVKEIVAVSGIVSNPLQGEHGG